MRGVSSLLEPTYFSARRRFFREKPIPRVPIQIASLAASFTASRAHETPRRIRQAFLVHHDRNSSSCRQGPTQSKPEPGSNRESATFDIGPILIGINSHSRHIRNSDRYFGRRPGAGGPASDE